MKKRLCIGNKIVLEEDVYEEVEPVNENMLEVIEVCCEVFGCGRLLSRQEKLFGNKCIEHVIKNEECMRKKKIITEEQLAYIREHHETMPVSQIGRNIGLTDFMVDITMRRNGIKVKKVKPDIDWENDVWNDDLHRELYPNL